MKKSASLQLRKSIAHTFWSLRSDVVVFVGRRIYMNCRHGQWTLS